MGIGFKSIVRSTILNFCIWSIILNAFDIDDGRNLIITLVCILLYGIVFYKVIRVNEDKLFVTCLLFPFNRTIIIDIIDIENVVLTRTGTRFVIGVLIVKMHDSEKTFIVNICKSDFKKLNDVLSVRGISVQNA